MGLSKRILFLADINSIHTQRWVKNLERNGASIGIYSLSAKSSNWIDDYNNIEYRCAGFTNETVRSNSDYNKFGYFSAAKEVRRFLKEFNPDIVHAHYASSYGMLAMRMRFNNTIISLWGSDVYEFPKRSILHRLLFKRVVSKAKIVCSTSKDMANEAAKYVNREYVITPFGVDTKRFMPNKTVHNDLVIGTVKSLEVVYGIDRLLKLFAKFLEKTKLPAQLFIYGKGAQEEKLRSLAQELGVKDQVHFKGQVEKEDLIAAFNSLDIFVALSRSESFGVAVLEAESCGVPVLTSNVGGLPEVVFDSQYVIDGDDLDTGVQKLIELSDEQKRNKIGLAARTFVEENYSEEFCLERLIKVYEQI